jgi:aerobic-type carbon monoxide dehydrogenase small subunit (CoxS/CutS family)
MHGRSFGLREHYERIIFLSSGFRRITMTKSRDDEAQQSANHNPSRRNFLKGVGIAGAGAAIADQLWTEAEAKENQTGAQTVSGATKITLDVNGQKRPVEVEPRTTLLNALRNHLEPAVTGPKLVCDMGTCGACTVLLDGKPVYSCLVLAVDATSKKITTVEGLGSPEKPNAVQAAFVEHDALMCGFCTPGFVTTISAYLKKNPNPSLAEVREACKGNFCRCGTYPRVFAAALAAAKSSSSPSQA